MSDRPRGGEKEEQESLCIKVTNIMGMYENIAALKILMIALQYMAIKLIKQVKY